MASASNDSTADPAAAVPEDQAQPPQDEAPRWVKLVTVFAFPAVLAGMVLLISRSGT